MLEQNFVIYHRAASLSSHASSVDVCTHNISNSVILSNNYVLLLSDLCISVQVKKMATVLQ